MRQSTLIILLVLIGQSVAGQNEVDALRYSQLSQGGSARFNSMGGAFGALGGEISSLGINPAGIGIYRKSEFTITGAFRNDMTKSTYLGNEILDNKFNLNIGNLGAVWAFSTANASGWKAVNFGINYSRVNSFFSRYTIAGINNSSSLLDVYKDELNANNIEPSNIDDLDKFAFGSNLAWQTFLIDTLPGTTEYTTVLSSNGETQRNTITSAGSMGETVFSVGGNYEDKFFLGGTFGVSSITFSQESSYTEITAESDTTTLLNQFNLTENLNTNGSGFNFKIGMIYKVHDYFRIGAAFHSPTMYELKDSWRSTMSSEFEGGNEYSHSSPKGNYDYYLITPYKAVGSMAVIFGQNGLLSMDLEYLDYTTATLSARYDGYDFFDENSAIRDQYDAAVNVKIGTEWKLDPLSLRAGVGLYGNSFNAATAGNSSSVAYSAGIGFRDQGYFLDFGYILSNKSQSYYPYKYAEQAQINHFTNNFMITLGLRY